MFIVCLTMIAVTGTASITIIAWAQSIGKHGNHILAWGLGTGAFFFGCVLIGLLVTAVAMIVNKAGWLDE